MTLDIMENPKEEIDAQLARSESPRPALSKEEEENEGAVGGVSEGASGGAGEGVSGESGKVKKRYRRVRRMRRRGVEGEEEEEVSHNRKRWGHDMSKKHYYIIIY